MDLFDMGRLAGVDVSCARLGNGAENKAAVVVRKWRLLVRYMFFS